LSFLIFIVYEYYCKKKLKGCFFEFGFDKSLFYSLLNFSGWNLLGNLSWMTMGQGLNILLNIFFGPTVNAARGIAFQVNGAVSTFVNNFRIAVNPQIVKYYAVNDLDGMKKLVFESAKFSYYLILLISLPVLLETKMILSIWLKIVPEYTILFCQLILINSLIQTFDASFAMVFQAIGKIKENQIMASSVYLLVLPISYLMLKLGYLPEITFYIQIFATIIVSFFVKVYLLVKIVKIHILEYLNRLIFPVLKVSLASIILPFLLKNNMNEGLMRFILVGILSIVSVTFSVYYLGINKEMRIKIHSILISRFDRYIGWFK